MNTTFRSIDPWLAHPPVIKLEDLPEEMQNLAKKISQIEDQKEALLYTYDVLAQKYRGYRILTFLRLDRFFIKDFSTLWQINGFLHCNHLNYLLHTLLVASGKFSSDEIISHWTHIWFYSPHQYLTFRLKTRETVAVDLWGKAYGILFGDYAHGLNAGSLFASESK